MCPTPVSAPKIIASSAACVKYKQMPTTHQNDGAVHGLSHAEGAAQPVHADASPKPSDGLIAALHLQPAHWLHAHTAIGSNANTSQGSAQARASSLMTHFQSVVSATGMSAAQRIAQAAARGWSLAEVEEGLLKSMVYSFTLLTLHSKRWSRQPHDAHYVVLFPQPVPQQLRVISRFLSIFKAGSSVSKQFETAQRDVNQDSGLTWLEERSEDADDNSLCTIAAALCQELRSLKLLSADIPRDVAKLMPQQLQPAYVLGLLRCKPEVQQGYADQFADFLIDLAKQSREESSQHMSAQGTAADHARSELAARARLHLSPRIRAPQQSLELETAFDEQSIQGSPRKRANQESFQAEQAPMQRGSAKFSSQDILGSAQTARQSPSKTIGSSAARGSLRAHQPAQRTPRTKSRLHTSRRHEEQPIGLTFSLDERLALAPVLTTGRSKAVLALASSLRHSALGSAVQSHASATQQNIRGNRLDMDDICRAVETALLRLQDMLNPPDAAVRGSLQQLAPIQQLFILSAFFEKSHAGGDPTQFLSVLIRRFCSSDSTIRPGLLQQERLDIHTQLADPIRRLRRHALWHNIFRNHRDQQNVEAAIRGLPPALHGVAACYSAATMLNLEDKDQALHVLRDGVYQVAQLLLDARQQFE